MPHFSGNCRFGLNQLILSRLSNLFVVDREALPGYKVAYPTFWSSNTNLPQVETILCDEDCLFKSARPGYLCMV
jgi:hypothetical protein